jgi:thiol:disulfide interchange protein
LGIESLEVDLTKDLFRITYDPERVSPERMLEAVGKKGLQAEVVKDTAVILAKVSRVHRNLGRLPTELRRVVEEAKGKKPVLVAFYGPGCPPCERMDDETYHDASVDEELRRWVFLRVDIAKHREVAQLFDVAGIPMVVAVTVGGDELGRVENFVEPATFRRWLERLWPK